MTLIRTCEVRAVRQCGEVVGFYRACDTCRLHVLRMVGDIGDEYARLSTIPTMSTAPGGGGGHPGSKSPARDHIIAMLDPRSSPNGPGMDDRPDVYSIPAVVGAWCREAWEASEDPFPSTMWDAFAYLRTKVDWFMRQDTAADFVKELREVQAQMRALVDPRQKVGECPTVLYLATDDTPEIRCDAPLRAGFADDAIHCRACGTTWYRPWTDLWAAIGGQTTMDYATISEWLGVSVRTLWRWSAEDGWVRQNTGKRALWLTSAALASCQRRRHKQAS